MRPSRGSMRFPSHKSAFDCRRPDFVPVANCIAVALAMPPFGLTVGNRSVVAAGDWRDPVAASTGCDCSRSSNHDCDRSPPRGCYRAVEPATCCRQTDHSGWWTTNSDCHSRRAAAGHNSDCRSRCFVTFARRSRCFDLDRQHWPARCFAYRVRNRRIAARRCWYWYLKPWRRCRLENYRSC